MRILCIALLLCGSLSVLAQTEKRYAFYFPFNATNLTPGSAAELQTAVKSIQASPPLSVSIEGYTDSTGGEAYNRSLSHDRAVAIASLLKPYLPAGMVLEISGRGKEGNRTLAPEEARRVDAVLHYAAAKPEDLIVEPYREEAPLQRFAVNLDDTVIVQGAEGTWIKIAPGSLQTKGGRTATGSATVLLQEYYRPGAIMLAGLHSSSDQGLLQSGGMFCLRIVQQKDTVQQKTLKPVELRLPALHKGLESGMTVFSMPGHDTTTQWRNTGRSFSYTGPSWNWPYQDSTFLGDVPHEEEKFYTNMAKGRRYSDDAWIGGYFLNLSRSRRPYIKHYSQTVQKVDSTTLQVSTTIRYRNRGYRATGRRRMDTVYTVPYERPEYWGFTSELNWINCDRFLQYNNKTDFYVSTPGYKGLQVMVYFKNLQSFLPSQLTNGYYTVAKVPADMQVMVVAFGKKGDQFFFGQQPYLISGKGRTAVAVKAVDEATLKRSLQEL